jgi:predicted esterase
MEDSRAASRRLQHPTPNDGHTEIAMIHLKKFRHATVMALLLLTGAGWVAAQAPGPGGPPAPGGARGGPPPGAQGPRATAPTPPVTTTLRGTGDQQRQYVFSPTGQTLPYRLYVPTTWNGKDSLPILLFLHGAGANERTYLDMADGMLRKLAEQHGYIVVSPLGFTAMGAYGNPIRLPAVFGQSEEAAKQRAAVTPERRRELALSELEVITVLELVTEEYGADRARTFLAGHSMGSGGTWHLAARWPDRWAAVAPISGPFVDEKTYPFDTIRKLPIFMTEGTAADPSLAGSRALDKFLKAGKFDYQYMEVDGNHGSMVPMVWPAVFDFFDKVSARKKAAK